MCIGVLEASFQTAHPTSLESSALLSAPSRLLGPLLPAYGEARAWTLSHPMLASVLFALALTAVLLLYRAFLLGWFNHVVPFLTGMHLTPDSSSLPFHTYDVTEAIRRRPPQQKFVGMTPVARCFRPLSWQPVYLSEQDQSMHRHVMGQTGSGKTLSAI
ncbi:hypothetical protein D7W82_13480 [Corallococcus sp. CA049B]|nr:hypothetical protein D7W82_13480 [Corallococcus sp. CA049B]